MVELKIKTSVHSEWKSKISLVWWVTSFLLLCSAGTVMTPNYVRSLGISLSPWCDCSSSGNSKTDCDKFAEFFTNNRCLREFPYSAILAFWDSRMGDNGLKQEFYVMVQFLWIWHLSNNLLSMSFVTSLICNEGHFYDQTPMKNILWFTRGSFFFFFLNCSILNCLDNNGFYYD